MKQIESSSFFSALPMVQYTILSTQLGRTELVTGPGATEAQPGQHMVRVARPGPSLDTGHQQPNVLVPVCCSVLLPWVTSPGTRLQLHMDYTSNTRRGSTIIDQATFRLPHTYLFPHSNCPDIMYLTLYQIC